MPRNGSVVGCVFAGILPSANTATAPPVGSWACVLRGVLMPAFTMSPGASLGRANGSPQLEALKINSLNWGHNLFESKIFGGALNNSVGFVTAFLSKLYRLVFFVLNKHIDCSALISLLFFACAPFAILGAIVLIIVLSIQSEAIFMSGPHINKELFVISSPLWAYSYATAAIIFVLACFFVVAPIKHAAPRAIKRWITIFPRHGAVYSKACAVMQLGA